jgi:hypothetical protein
MATFSAGVPWYIAGLAFECDQCGRCCAGPDEGYVWIGEDELRTLAAFLGQDLSVVRQRYTRPVGARQTLIEDCSTKDCIFLQPGPVASGKGCTVYEVRPAQCRTWPFWPANLTSPDAWARAAQRCPGINRGTIHAFHEIQAKRQATES